MDKTIEERIEEIAIEVGNNCVNFYGNEVDFSCIEDGLRQIATEQKEIDESDLQTAKQTYYDAGYEAGVSKTIDKACEWIEKNADKYAVDEHWVSSRLVEHLRKYLEE